MVFVTRFKAHLVGTWPIRLEHLQIIIAVIIGCLQVFFSIAFAASGIAGAQMAFPDVTKASSAVKRVFSGIDRQPGSADAGMSPPLHVPPECTFFHITSAMGSLGPPCASL